jgi:pyrroloquinoline-quinone synthase
MSPATTNSSNLKQRMDEATKEARLLEHPFYKAWAAGELTLDDLSFYSAQYWRQVESFPDYLSTIESRLPDGRARQTVAENLRDEVEGNHLGLWLEFAAGVGATRDTVTNSSPESQTPEVAATKIKGLREYYGIDGPALEYFELHGELDIEHSDDLAQAIATLVVDEAAAREAEAGAKAGAEAIWGLLNGIARERGMSPNCN